MRIPRLARLRAEDREVCLGPDAGSWGLRLGASPSVESCKLQPTDAPAMEHECWSKVLQTLLTYDQVDVTNLAGVEMIVRNLQRIEEKRKFKLCSVDDAGEGALFMGATSGVRTGSIICPRPTEWIGSEMQKEAMVAKERRKAREERALSRKGDKDNSAGK